MDGHGRVAALDQPGPPQPHPVGVDGEVDLAEAQRHVVDADQRVVGRSSRG